MRKCIVSLYWVPGLVVSHFIEVLSVWDSFACIDIHDPNLCFRRWGHNCFHDLCYVEHCFIVGGERDILGNEKVSTSPASCLRFTEVRGVAVDCQNQVGRFIGKYSMFLWCCIIQNYDLLFWFLIFWEMLVQIRWLWGRREWSDRRYAHNKGNSWGLAGCFFCFLS